jgi:hypothetical protein
VNLSVADAADAAADEDDDSVEVDEAECKWVVVRTDFCFSFAAYGANAMVNLPDCELANKCGLSCCCLSDEL